MTVQFKTEAVRTAVESKRLHESYGTQIEEAAAAAVWIAKGDSFEAAVGQPQIAQLRGVPREIFNAAFTELMATVSTAFGDAAAIAAKIKATVPRFDVEASIASRSEIKLTPAQIADAKQRAAALNAKSFAITSVWQHQESGTLHFDGYFNDTAYRLAVAANGGWNAELNVSRDQHALPALLAPWSMQQSPAGYDFYHMFTAKVGSTADLLGAMEMVALKPFVKNAETAKASLAAAAAELGGAGVTAAQGWSHGQTDEPMFELPAAGGQAQLLRTVTDWSIKVSIPKDLKKELGEPWRRVGAFFQGGNYLHNAVFALRAPSAQAVAEALKSIG